MDSLIDEARREAHRIIDEIFGVDPTVTALVRAAHDASIGERSDALIDCVRETRLTRRGFELGELAGVIGFSRTCPKGR